MPQTYFKSLYSISSHFSHMVGLRGLRRPPSQVKGRLRPLRPSPLCDVAKKNIMNGENVSPSISYPHTCQISHITPGRPSMQKLPDIAHLRSKCRADSST